MSRQRPIPVSIIMPIYRCADTLGQALDSVLAQRCRDWELIAVDDGSPDDSGRIVRQYARSLNRQDPARAGGDTAAKDAPDVQIRLLRQSNAGACAARNTGIAAARGKYLLFLDSDDSLEPDALAQLLDACEANRLHAAHGMHRFVQADGTPTERLGGYTGSEPLFKALSASNALAIHAVLLRRDLLGRIGLFDTTLKHCGDWDLWQRLARSGARVGHVPHVVANYRMRSTSLSRNPASLLRDGIEVLGRIHGPDPRVKPFRAAQTRPSRRETTHEPHRRDLSEGYDPGLLGLRIAYFALYTAGLSIAEGSAQQVEALLDVVPRWPKLDPGDAASCLFWAICFSRCQGPEHAPQFWPVVRKSVRQICEELQRRTGQQDLADEIARSINFHSGWRITE